MADVDYRSADDRKYERGPVLRRPFGPSKAEVWTCSPWQIGGEFKDGGCPS